MGDSLAATAVPTSAIPWIEASRWTRRATDPTPVDGNFDAIDGGSDRGAHPWSRATLAPRCLVAWPRWGQGGAARAVLEAAAPALVDGFAALLIAFDEERDGRRTDRDSVGEQVASAVLDLFGDADVEVLVVALPRLRSERVAACGVAAATVVVGDLRDGLRLGGFPAPLLRDRAAVEAWRRAVASSERTSVPRRRAS